MLHTWQSFDSPLQLFMQGDVFARWIPRAGRIDVEQHELIRVESNVLRGERRKSSQEEPRTDDQQCG